jgi:hypothetical protein
LCIDLSTFGPMIKQAKQEGERNEEDEPRAIKMAKGLQRHREKSNHKANNKIKG